MENRYLDRIVEIDARLELIRNAFRESEKLRRKLLDAYKVLYGEYKKAALIAGLEIELRDVTED